MAAVASQECVHLVTTPRPFLARAVGHLDPDGLVLNVPDQLAGDVSLGAHQVNG
jgi:hypothetical protein